MNRPIESLLQDTTMRDWSERNQRWLSARLAHWRERIKANTDAGTADAGTADAESDNAADTLTPAIDDGFEPAALRVGAAFGLSPFETELLVLAAGVEIDAALRDAVARAQGAAPGRPVRLSFALALTLLPQPHWDAISPLGPLRGWSLIEFDASNGFTQATLRIDERILHELTGVGAFDERILGIARLGEVGDAFQGLELSQQIAASLASKSGALVVLANALIDADHVRGGRWLAGTVFRQMGLRALWVDFAAFAADAHQLVEFARRLDREALLSQAGIVLSLGAEPVHAAGALRLAGMLGSPTILLGAASPVQLAELPDRQVLRFNVPRAKAGLMPGLSAHLHGAARSAVQQFRVDPSLLEQALGSVVDVEDEAAAERALWHALREAARGGLDSLAQRIESSATFEDLVVPPFVAMQLREIAGQLRHRQMVYEEWGFGEQHGRGLGIAALFAGESGTGKTLAAEAIANEARLDLYRIDLANVVSKYIGETEKSLGRLFDAAEASGAILLFDEADALFGKRSDVKDSHDRYANIEVAYLLQRVESYRGLAILTTNMKSALDRAFLRRLRFVVQFPFPDAGARERIWKKQFPAAAPLGTIDFAGLSRLQLTGGNIRSVAINAAFRAADARRAIDHELLVEAVHIEHAKLERTMTGVLYGGPA